MSIAYDEQAREFMVILGDNDIIQGVSTARTQHGSEEPRRVYAWHMKQLASAVPQGTPIHEDAELAADIPGMAIGVRSAGDARIFARRMLEFADWIESQDQGLVG